VGARGSVFAFEADPAMFEILARNVAEMPWVQALPHAVWKQERALIFERSSSPGESGWGTLTAVRDLGKGQHVKVHAIALDEWASRVQLHCLQAMKIDAEGSEFAILSGAQNTLARFRPLLFLEMNDVLLRQAGASSQELAAKLRHYNYNLFGLSWLKVRQVAKNRPPDNFEVLAIPTEKTEAVLHELRVAKFHVC
jgi:FkbM family methyltransferase